jgi:UDP-2,3-diacylglucosamine pyrophosphatase LpxH
VVYFVGVRSTVVHRHTERISTSAAYVGQRETEIRPETPTVYGAESGVLAVSRVVVAGDAHLGADNANVEAFNEFLGDLYADRGSVDEVVLLGDIWDIVRRDPFGVAWETTETLERLNSLAEAVPVRFVLGNHDTYLRNLDDARYGLDIRESYTLEQNGTQVLFRHGDEFDRLHSSRLSEYLSGAGDRGDIDPTRGRKDPVVAGVRELVCRFKTRLRPDGGEPRAYPRRESRAHSYLGTVAADKLVYGHTHAPYVHHENIAANPGSWKSTAPTHNTYVEVTGGELALYRYVPDGEDEPVE